MSIARPVTMPGLLPVHAPPGLDRLAFSRGAGAGFLVWCRRQGRKWTLFDKEVAWTIQVRREPEEGPLLAP